MGEIRLSPTDRMILRTYNDLFSWEPRSGRLSDTALDHRIASVAGRLGLSVARVRHTIVVEWMRVVPYESR